ncbi:hypothetical protein CEXT_639071 [Caerostris extrusa]|uniref:Uncharacterized protein n=1 Tax=Caerostris extrusa TaxID=172846 RepID=A0AAV4WLX4_CAEEX|nr:hypothetical protein CEXT_639071 [Caerostris extrusa]
MEKAGGGVQKWTVGERHSPSKMRPKACVTMRSGGGWNVHHPGPSVDSVPRSLRLALKHENRRSDIKVGRTGPERFAAAGLLTSVP